MPRVRSSDNSSWPTTSDSVLLSHINNVKTTNLSNNFCFRIDYQQSWDHWIIESYLRKHFSNIENGFRQRKTFFSDRTRYSGQTCNGCGQCKSMLCCHKLQLKKPLVRKNGHICLQWDQQNEIRFTYPALRELHQNCSHPSSDKVFNLLKLARPRDTDTSTKHFRRYFWKMFSLSKIWERAYQIKSLYTDRRRTYYRQWTVTGLDVPGRQSCTTLNWNGYTFFCSHIFRGSWRELWTKCARNMACICYDLVFNVYWISQPTLHRPRLCIYSRTMKTAY